MSGAIDGSQSVQGVVEVSVGSKKTTCILKGESLPKGSVITLFDFNRDVTEDIFGERFSERNTVVQISEIYNTRAFIDAVKTGGRDFGFNVRLKDFITNLEYHPHNYDLGMLVVTERKGSKDMCALFFNLNYTAGIELNGDLPGKMRNISLERPDLGELCSRIRYFLKGIILSWRDPAVVDEDSVDTTTGCLDGCIIL